MPNPFLVWGICMNMSVFLSRSKLATAERRLRTEQPCSAKLNSLNCCMDLLSRRLETHDKAAWL